MAVTPAETAAFVRTRREAEEQRAVARAERALEAARTIARALVERFGARRVLLFGSLARGDVHPGSDIHLAVEGLDAAAIFDAGAALDELAAPCDLDLVSWERLPARQRARLERHGIRLA